jgi:ribose transport system substrate-binding protein
MNRSMGRAWTRRDALRASAIGGGALALGATGFGAGFARHAWAQSNDQDFDRAACYQAGEGSQPIQFDAQEGPFAVALSNSYIGNVWRTQMINMANVFVTRPDIEPMITDWQVASSGEDVAAQIAQTENMLSAGAQAIIINSISPTALTPVCQRAIDDGIPVVAFDAIVEAEGIVIVNEDQFEMGKLWAEFLIETAGESGKILMIQGVQGTSVDTDRNAGGRSVFDQYPDIEIVEVLGQWDPGTAQTVTATRLPRTMTSPVSGARAEPTARCAHSSRPAVSWSRSLVKPRMDSASRCSNSGTRDSRPSPSVSPPHWSQFPFGPRSICSPESKSPRGSRCHCR